MKIINEGTVLRFECESCGCIFEEGANKVEDFGFYKAYDCPCCGEKIKRFPDPVSAIIGLQMSGEKNNESKCLCETNNAYEE